MCEKKRKISLGDLINLEYGFSLPDSVRKPGQIPVFGSNGQVGFHNVSSCLGPGIIIGRKGSVGKICWSAEPFWPIDTTYYVTSKKTFEFRWLYWTLLHCDLAKLNSSTGVPGLNRNDVYSVSINYEHLEIQKAIATILDTLDTTIQQTQALIAKLKQVKAGMLYDLLTRGLDNNGELRDPIRHPEQFKDSSLGRIPKEWVFNSLDYLIQDLETGVSVNAWNKPISGGDIGILKTSCVNSGSFFSKENKTVLPLDKGRVSCPVRDDSIIISRMNTPLLVGESGYVEQGFSNLYLPDRLWQLLLREERKASAKWLSYVFIWEPIRKLIQDIATGTSGSMKNISQKTFLAICISIPQPEEQRAIATRINSVDELLTKEIRKQTKLTFLKQALMKDLLSGKVRVPENMMEAMP